LAKTLRLATEHPWLAKMITEGGKGAATGGTIGTIKGAQKDQAVEGGVAGAVVGGPAGAATAAGGEIISRLKNPFRPVLRMLASPKEVQSATEQQAVQPAVRELAKPVGESFRSGIDVAKPFAEAKAGYGVVDNAAKTNFKTLYDNLDRAHTAVWNSAPGSVEESQAQGAIQKAENDIEAAKQVARDNGVTDIDERLKAADTKFQEAQANKELNYKFFGNQSVIKGNVAHGAPESINVNSAINVLENMDKPSLKYGTSRLQQTSLGQTGTRALKYVLYAAQDKGEKAMARRVLRNRLLTLGGVSIPILAALYEGAEIANK
jgi:hypothetical protein